MFFFPFKLSFSDVKIYFHFTSFYVVCFQKKRYYFVLSSLSILDENKIITFATSISCIRTVLAVCSWRICYSVFNKFQKMTQTLQTYWIFSKRNTKNNYKMLPSVQVINTPGMRYVQVEIVFMLKTKFEV